MGNGAAHFFAEGANVGAQFAGQGWRRAAQIRHNLPFGVHAGVVVIAAVGSGHAITDKNNRCFDLGVFSYGAPGRNKVLAPLQVDTISVFGERDGASFRHDRDFAQGNSLIERARSARGREAEDFKLRSDITSGQFLATRACAAAFEQVGGQKGHVGAEWFFRELLHGLAHLGGNGRAYLGGGAVTKKDQRKEKQAAKQHERLQPFVCGLRKSIAKARKAAHLEGIGAEAEEGVAAAGDEGSDGFALEVAGLAQQCGKFRAGADAVQPGVTHHRGIAEETVVDGAGEYLQKRWRRVESESNSRITFRATTRRKRCRPRPSRLRQFLRECGTDQCSRGFPAWGMRVALRLKHIRLFAVSEDCYECPASEGQTETVGFRRFRAARQGGRTRLFAWWSGGARPPESETLGRRARNLLRIRRQFQSAQSRMLLPGAHARRRERAASHLRCAGWKLSPN